VQEQALNILYCNSLTERKGLQLLLRALGTLVSPEGSSPTQFFLTVAGDGEDGPALEALAAELLPAESFTFVGRVPYSRLNEIYGQSDIVVCPTISDYRSLAPFEALTARRPVIVSIRDGSSKDLAGLPGVTVVDPTDADKFRQALQQLLTDDSQLRREALAAEVSGRDFSFERVAQKFASSLAEKLGIL
jgi:glycosyltransferase involved in cell wall biosynthesis